AAVVVVLLVDVTIKELTATRAGDVSQLVCNGSMIGQDQAILEQGRAASGKAMGPPRRQAAIVTGEVPVVSAPLR
ncbi:hypothetical protein DKP78_26450, partial [Enterococcus faecium]